MSARRTLLVVLEPEDGGEELGAGEDRAAGQTAAASPGVVSEANILASEATRLANELAAEAHLVTWKPLPDLPPGAVAAAVAGLAERVRPTAVLLADTDLGRELAPMVAHRLGSGAVVGCSDVLCRRECGQGTIRAGASGRSACLVFVKPVYGGWLEQEMEAVEGYIPVVTLDLSGMSGYEPSLESLSPPEVLEVKPSPTAAVRSLEVIPPDPGTVDLVHARRIVAAGSGSVSGGLLSAARELAELLDGSVGATRPVVDDGEVPKERLIGQTGRTVTPDLYMALGISGSPHHIAGVKEAGRFLAINRDPRAPIFQFSDTGYVADLEAVLPALVEKLKEYRDGVDSAG